MRAPASLRPRPVADTFVSSAEQMEEERRRWGYSSVNSDINLPVRDVVAALHEVMLTVQYRVSPTVTLQVHQHRYSYYVTMRWQSRTGQIQLRGSASALGLSIHLTNVFGETYEVDGRDRLAWWNCTRDTWDHRGDLDLYRLEGRMRSIYLSTTLTVFEKVPPRESYVRLSPHLRPDLIEDIVEVTQVYVSALD